MIDTAIKTEPLTFACLIALIFILLTISNAMAADLGDSACTMWSPHLEWQLSNPSWSDNPFDVVTTVTFVHADSGETRVTEMFYDGGDTWKFRFTGTRLGAWTFTTTSNDAPLNGHTGTITVKPNPDNKIKGFLTHQGNKYAIQRNHTDDLEGYVFTVYMGRVNFDSYLDTFTPDLSDMAQKNRAYLAEALDNGFEAIFIHVNNNWFKYGVREHNKHDSQNPDLTTFSVLETIITTAHQAGCRVHLWAWGDESRKWTPKGVPGGINGAADRRLQRYIAARLGPLPGWTMGYGFDLHEWTNSDELNSWATYMHDHFGWQHLLSARGYILSGPNNVNSYDGFGRKVPLCTKRHGPKDYQEIVEDMESIAATPHFYEERHTYKRTGFDLDMDGTRRLLWWEVMAGGMGGFFGFYPPKGRSFGEHPYPNPEQLCTHYTFWHTHRRFLLDMQRDNELSSNGAYVLKNADGTHYVLYKEAAGVIEIDLSQMNGSQRAVAVDTKKAYAEVDLGTLKPTDQTIKLPFSSDWAIAVGEYPAAIRP